MMRRKLLHRMKEVCGVTGRIMKDELIVEEHQVDGTRILIYIYIYLYIDVVFLPYIRHKQDVIASCTFLASLLQCIGHNFCINYIQIVVFLYIILRVTFFFFFVSIIECHNCSYSAILNSFLYLQIQLYDTFSLSPSCALDNSIG